MTNPMQMGRIEIVYELRKHFSKERLDLMLVLPTADLRSHLVYHASIEDEKCDGRVKYDHYERVGQPAKRSYKKGEVMVIALNF